MNKIKELNSVLTNVVLRECKSNKKILLTFSGGMDTRVILSIMLKNGIRPHLLTWDGSPGDIKIAKNVAKSFKLGLIVIKRKTSDLDWLERVNKIIAGYDTIFYGELMSEIFNKFVRFTESEKKLNDIIDNFFKWVDDNVDKATCNKVMPCLDKEVIKIVEEIPICFRIYGYINRRLINMNYQDLMQFKHTTVNLRYRVLETIYWMFIPILEHYLRRKKICV